MKVLVCAASKHDATKEIAEAIGRRLADAGLTVDVNDVAEVNDLTGYDAVVLGSAVYMGNWLESARRFATEHAGELAARPTWLFSSGPTGDPPRLAPERAVSIDAITTNISPQHHQLFAGKLDRHQLSFPERAVVLAVRGAEGDFRDWEEIAGWAAEIAAALTRSRAQHAGVDQVRDC
jgi:menaquinone-dependent protoporphyrinogen oxidase